MGDVGMRARRHLRPRQCLLRQGRQRRVGREIERRECLRICGKRMRVDESDVDLVEGVGGQRVVLVEARRDRRGEAGDQALHLLPGFLVSRDRVGTRQTRHVLSEAMARYETVHILGRIEAGGCVVPAAEILAGRRQAGREAKWLQQRILVHGQ